MKKPQQSKKKPAGKARKTPKPVAPARAEKAPRTRERDPRLPAVGTTIVRPYKGKDIRVKVLADGFEYEGAHYRSLTKVALVATGYNAISGPAFFRLTDRPAPTPKGKTPKSREKSTIAESATPETAPAAESSAN